MIRSQSTRLAQARAMINGLAVACLALATVAGGEAIALDNAHKASEAVSFAEADARAAMAKCGAYDVFIIGHGGASADDARKAALSYVGDGCEYVRGLKPGA